MRFMKNQLMAPLERMYSPPGRVLGDGLSITLLKKIQENFFVQKVSKIGTEYRYRCYFLKNVPLSVPSLLFCKIPVSISSLLSKYRMHSSDSQALHIGQTIG